MPQIRDGHPSHAMDAHLPMSRIGGMAVTRDIRQNPLPMNERHVWQQNGSKTWQYASAQGNTERLRRVIADSAGALSSTQ